METFIYFKEYAKHKVNSMKQNNTTKTDELSNIKTLTLSGLVLGSSLAILESITQQYGLGSTVKTIGEYGLIGAGAGNIGTIGKAFISHQIKIQNNKKERKLDKNLVKTIPELIKCAKEMNQTYDTYYTGESVDKNLVARKKIKEIFDPIYKNLLIKTNEGDYVVDKTTFKSNNSYSRISNYGIRLKNKNNPADVIVARNEINSEGKIIFYKITADKRISDTKISYKEERIKNNSATNIDEQYLKAMLKYSTFKHQTDEFKKAHGMR